MPTALLRVQCLNWLLQTKQTNMVSDDDVIIDQQSDSDSQRREGYDVQFDSKKVK